MLPRRFQKSISRRSALKVGGAALLGGFLSGPGVASNHLPMKSKCIPVVHTTDLYQPPQDPDDQVDLATVLGLEELDVRGVILDCTDRFLVAKPTGWDIDRNPGHVLVEQIAHLCGRSLPVARGPVSPLNHPRDTALDRPVADQAGIELLLELLKTSEDPVLITVTGSARVVTAAFNREPELMRAKTRAVVLNAGSTGGSKREWNVGLDLNAFIGLWQSDLPIHWYPCGTEKSAFVRQHERGTYWKVKHDVLFHELAPSLRSWFAYGFSGSSREDSIRALDDMSGGPEWQEVLQGERNLWSTASLVMAAGRVLARTAEGWRFISKGESRPLETWPWRIDPIEAEVDPEGRVSWKLADRETGRYLFGRKPDLAYGEAMAEALNALLRALR